MGGVMPAVPGVEAGGEIDGHGSVDGVAEAALPLLLLKGLEEHDPARVEGFDEVERPLDGGGGVVEGGPGLFVVGLDGRPVLGKGEFDAEEGVHVGVGDVVDELANGPTAVAVGGSKLIVAEVLNGVAEVGGQVGKDADGGKADLMRDGLRALEFSDGVPGIEQFGRHWELLCGVKRKVA